MKKIAFLFHFGFIFLIQTAFAQTTLWLEADRKYLLEQMTRSRDEVLKETDGLTEAQWNFKETPDRWSIKQVVEHIAIWEMLLQHEISNSFEAGPQPERVKTAEPDSISLNFIMDTKPFPLSMMLNSSNRLFSFTVNCSKSASQYFTALLIASLTNK